MDVVLGYYLASTAAAGQGSLVVPHYHHSTMLNRYANAIMACSIQNMSSDCASWCGQGVKPQLNHVYSRFH